MTTTPDQRLGEARRAVAGRTYFTLSWLQREFRLRYDQAVSLAEVLEAEGRIGPQWRETEKRGALRHYGTAAKALATAEQGQHIDGFAGPSDAREVAYGWHTAALRLGATEAELRQAVEDGAW